MAHCFTIPTQRVFLFEPEMEILGGSTSMPARPRIAGGETAKSPLVGGSKVLDLANAGSKLYVIVNSAGIPVMTGSPPRQKTYEASSPSNASVKAFYAWWRSSNQGAIAGGAHVPQRKADAELLHRLREMDLTKEQQDAFLHAWMNVEQKQLDKRLLVRVALAGGMRAVKNYIVAYELNTKPNKLEVLKRIVVTAKSTPLSASAPRPTHVIDLESVI